MLKNRFWLPPSCLFADLVIISLDSYFPRFKINYLLIQSLFPLIAGSQNQLLLIQSLFLLLVISVGSKNHLKVVTTIPKSLEQSQSCYNDSKVLRTITKLLNPSHCHPNGIFVTSYKSNSSGLSTIAESLPCLLWICPISTSTRFLIWTGRLQGISTI